MGGMPMGGGGEELASRCREAFVERQHGRPTTRVARERWLLSYVAKYIKYAMTLLTLPLDPPSPSLGSHLLETNCITNELSTHEICDSSSQSCLRPARTTSVPTLNADPLLRGTLRHPSSFLLQILYTAACPPRERIRKARRLPSRPSCKTWRAARPERWPCQWIRRPGRNAMQTSFVGALRSWAALHGARRASRTASATSSACRDSNTQTVLNIIASPPLPSMPSRYHRLMNHLMNE